MTHELVCDELEEAFQNAEADYSPAEAQAIACGMLSVNISADKNNWVKLLFGDIDETNASQLSAVQLSGHLFEHTKTQMQDSNLMFELLLPDENCSLNDRVKFIQEWCSGFLVGIGLSGVSDYKTLPEDTRELLADFTEIGTSGDLDLDDEESSEEAFAEISEYIRMGVLLINEELQPIKQSSQIH